MTAACLSLHSRVRNGRSPHTTDEEHSETLDAALRLFGFLFFYLPIPVFIPEACKLVNGFVKYLFAVSGGFRNAWPLNI